jgi:hypothetical protein
MRVLVGMVALVLMPLGAVAQQCPTGSHPWVDQWGNRICKSFDSGGTTTIQGSLKNCPTGTHPWTDEWGNRICKSFEGNKQYYDTSKGCPVGFHPWVDNWGNRVCRKL